MQLVTGVKVKKVFATRKSRALKARITKAGVPVVGLSNVG